MGQSGIHLEKSDAKEMDSRGKMDMSSEVKEQASHLRQTPIDRQLHNDMHHPQHVQRSLNHIPQVQYSTPKEPQTPPMIPMTMTRCRLVTATLAMPAPVASSFSTLLLLGGLARLVADDRPRNAVTLASITAILRFDSGKFEQGQGNPPMQGHTSASASCSND